MIFSNFSRLCTCVRSVNIPQSTVISEINNVQKRSSTRRGVIMGVPTRHLLGALRLIGNMLLINSGFHMRKNLARALRNVGQVYWRGAKSLACPERPHISGRPWLQAESKKPCHSSVQTVASALKSPSPIWIVISLPAWHLDGLEL